MLSAPSLAHCLAARARKTPDAPALQGPAASASFRQLAAQTAQRAAGLRGLGLPDDAIVALAAPARDLAMAALACSWAGLPLLPLATDVPESRWQQLRARAPMRMHRFATLPATATDSAARPAASDEDSTALLIATSGSEGVPKVAMLSQRALAAAAVASAERIPLRAGDVWLDCLPLNHIGGLAILWRCLAAGATVHLHDGFDAERVWHAIASGSVTHISLVPAMLARLLEVADAVPPPAFRCALIGGAALSHPLWQRARRAGWPLFVSYGMSETAAQLATLPPTDDWHPGLVGRPLPGMTAAIGDDGRIRVRGPQLMSGYLGDEWPPVDAEGWLTTGDLGRIDADGRLTVLGRADDMLVSAGVNIDPAEVEIRLAACPGISDVAVAAERDPVWGDVLAALLVGNADAGAVRDWCRRHLPAAQRPRRFLNVAALPRNAMGKLDRPALAVLLAGLG